MRQRFLRGARPYPERRRATLLLTAAILLCTLVIGDESAGGGSGITASVEIDALLEAAVREARIPGLAVVVFDSQGVGYSRAIGTSDVGGGRVTAQTPFVIGSISKAVTAYAVLDLVYDGKLKLDEPVSRYLAWADPRITISDLLRQTSGYSGRDGVDFDRHAAHSTLLELVDTYPAAKLNRPPGTSFEYSNVNYNLLGAIVAQATGGSFADYVSERVFGRLGMTCSFTDLPAARSAGLENGHRMILRHPVAASDVPFFDAFLPSMTIVSCTADLPVLFEAILEQQASHSKRYGDIGAPRQGAVVDGYEGTYDYGYLTTRFEGERAYFFQGGYRTFRSYAFLLPDVDLGIVGLMNVNTMFSDGELRELVPNIARAVLGRSRPEPERSYSYATLPALLVAGVFLQAARTVRSFQSLKSGPRPLLCGLVAFDVSLAAALVFAVPYLWSIHLNTMMFIQPDLTLLLICVAGLSGAMAMIRISSLVVHSVRAARRPTPIRPPVVNRH